MKRLFVLTSRFPTPLDKGDKLRAYHQIVHLAPHYEIVLCSLSEETIDASHRAELAPYCRRVEVLDFQRPKAWIRCLGAVFGSKPLQAAYFQSSRLEVQVRQLLEETSPDAVLCQLLRTAAYVDGVDLPKVIDLQDAFSEGFAQRASVARLPWSWLLATESRRMRRAERRLIDRFDGCTIISEHDRSCIDHPDRLSIDIVRNGVDTATYRPRSIEPDHDLLFVGNMNYPPNIDAAIWLVNDILPRIRKARPHTSVLIAGTQPSRRVRDLAGPGVEVTGWVDDMATTYSRARLFIAPIRLGTGMHNKLLQAFASGVPSVVTELVNRSIGATETEVRVADGADALANAVLDLIDAPEPARELGLHGRAFVERRYQWSDATDSLRATIERSIAHYHRGQTASQVVVG